MARAVAETVENLRVRVKKRQKNGTPVDQITWPLGVKGNLRREDIYDYLDE